MWPMTRDRPDIHFMWPYRVHPGALGGPDIGRIPPRGPQNAEATTRQGRPLAPGPQPHVCSPPIPASSGPCLLIYDALGTSSVCPFLCPLCESHAHRHFSQKANCGSACAANCQLQAQGGAELELPRCARSPTNETRGPLRALLVNSRRSPARWPLRRHAAVGPLQWSGGRSI